MTHEELLHLIKSRFIVNEEGVTQAGVKEHQLRTALQTVVELCDKWETKGSYCLPIDDVIQIIKKGLK